MKTTEVEIVKLEDEKEYAVLDSLEVKETKYLLLGLLEEIGKDIDTPTIVIRKLDKKEKYIVGLEDEEEYNKVVNAFLEKEKVS